MYQNYHPSVRDWLSKVKRLYSHTIKIKRKKIQPFFSANFISLGFGHLGPVCAFLGGCFLTSRYVGNSHSEHGLEGASWPLARAPDLVPKGKYCMSRPCRHPGRGGSATTAPSPFPVRQPAAQSSIKQMWLCGPLATMPRKPGSFIHNMTMISPTL